jgi:hypothetical protein
LMLPGSRPACPLGPDPSTDRVPWYPSRCHTPRPRIWGSPPPSDHSHPPLGPFQWREKTPLLFQGGVEGDREEDVVPGRGVAICSPPAAHGRCEESMVMERMPRREDESASGGENNPPSVSCAAVFERRRSTSSISVRKGDGGGKHALSELNVKIVLTISRAIMPIMDILADSQDSPT